MQQTKEMLYALGLTLLGLTAATPTAAQVPGVGEEGALRTTAALKTASIHRAKPGAVAGKSMVSEITKMEVIADDDATRIVIVGTQPFTPDIRNYAQPAATVITIDGRWNAGRKSLTAIRKNGVMTVRAGQFSDSPQQVRIVANTQRILPFHTQSSPDKTRWEIVMDAPGSVKSDEPVKLNGPATAPMLSEPEPARSVAPVTNALPLPKKAKLVIVESKPLVTISGSDGALGVKTSTVENAPLLAGFKPVAILKPGHVNIEAQKDGIPAIQGDQSDEGRRVSLDFVAADINDVLKALSLQSGVNIVTSTDVKGTVTCSLRRVSFREAIDTVVNLSNYNYARVGSTYAVGTADGVAKLVRGSAVGIQMTDSIPFIFSDGSSLKEAVETAFPSVKGRVSLVTIGAEGKTATGSAVSTSSSGTSATQGPAQPKGATTTDRVVIEKVIPKGGVITVTGTQAEVDSVKQFIDATELALLTAPTREAEAKAKENAIISARSTEVYTIRYASAVDLIALVNRLVPSVSVQPGPAQGFNPPALGGSASFTTGGSAAASNGGATPAAGGNNSATDGKSTSISQNPSGRPSSTLLLTGTPEAIARAREVLTQMDVKIAQITYEARVVDTSLDDLKQLGFKYDVTRTVQVGEKNGDVKDIGPSGAEASSRNTQFGAILRSPYTIGVNLDALETKGRARTLARPNLSALDGQSAVAFIGDQIKYVINIQQTQQGQSIQTETATVGITLRVMGKTSPDGNITVYVHPEVSVISSFLNLSNGISLPQIATRFVDTQVRVKDGETFALGGLIRQQDTDSIRKVPFLGDLPFFGNLLFKNRDKERHNSEVVILLTPRILKD